MDAIEEEKGEERQLDWDKLLPYYQLAIVKQLDLRSRCNFERCSKSCQSLIKQTSCSIDSIVIQYDYYGRPTIFQTTQGDDVIQNALFDLSDEVLRILNKMEIPNQTIRNYVADILEKHSIGLVLDIKNIHIDAKDLNDLTPLEKFSFEKCQHLGLGLPNSEITKKFIRKTAPGTSILIKGVEEETKLEGYGDMEEMRKAVSVCILQKNDINNQQFMDMEGIDLYLRESDIDDDGICGYIQRYSEIYEGSMFKKFHLDNRELFDEKRILKGLEKIGWKDVQVESGIKKYAIGSPTFGILYIDHCALWFESTGPCSTYDRFAQCLCQIM